MFNLKEKLDENSKTSGYHSDETIKHMHDSMFTVADMTKLRIYVPHFPFSKIDYEPEDNYRKTGVSPDSESIRELGRAIQNAGLQQPIGLFAHDLTAEQLKEIASDSEQITTPETWSSRIGLIFGNRRFLAITHHTDIKAAGAYIYPSEIKRYRTDIALVENMDRQDVNIAQEALAIYLHIKNSYSGNISAFGRATAKDKVELGRLYKIGEACSECEDFKKLIAEEKTKDIAALDNIARGLLTDNSKLRDENIKSLMAELNKYDGKINNFRKFSKGIRDYAEGKSNVVPDTKQKEKQTASTKNDKQVTTGKTSSFNVSAFTRKLDKIRADLSSLPEENVEQVKKHLFELVETIKDKIPETK